MYANIETVGIVVSGQNLPSSAELMYRQGNDSEWKHGHPLMNIEEKHLVGSLFELTESTAYEVKVTDGINEIGGLITTQPEQLQLTPSKVLYVDDDAAPGGDGSAIAPFQTIQAGVNFATPGTQVLVADGIYREEVNLPASGTENNWIQIKAAGQNTILDGSRQLSGDIWHHSRYRNIWYTRVVTIFQYLARDGERFYRFETLADLVNTRTYGNTVLKEGWYFDPETLQLYVRSTDDPSNHTWQLPMLNQAFSARGQNWLWIEGFEVRYYGTTTSSCGVCMTDVSHVVIRKNRIHHLQIGVFIKWFGGPNQGNDTRIEYNEIYDSPVDEWPWEAVKSTSMEGTAILLRGHAGTIVRGNEIHNYFNGIYTGSSGDPHNFELALDVDVYDNYIHRIGDDAFEPEGACVNHRFRENIVEHAFAGLSLAPVTKGPVWALRTLYANYTGRALKVDQKSDGIALVYHNTFWSDKKNINAIDLISPAFNIVMRNNIFHSNGYLIKEVPTDSTGNDWDNNNLHTTKSLFSPHFKWDNIDYYNIKAFCNATGLECNSYTDDPGLSDPKQGLFTLQATSPNIDRGILIPGINDTYTGKAPDNGAYEYNLFNTIPTVASIAVTDENPTGAANVKFRVTFTEPVMGVGFLPPFHGFHVATNPEIPAAAIKDVTPVSDTIYDITVSTGGQDGSIRLDVIDDNSIFGQGQIPLGGIETGDGTFTTGEFYILDKTPPSVTQSLPLDPNPTRAVSINFAVKFSEPVNGVDKSDFSLSTNGTLNQTSIVSVIGAGDIYTVTVEANEGEGSLRLNVLDNDSIVDIMGHPLGGIGGGNGEYTSGTDYIIAKTSLIQNVKILYSVGKYDGWIRESRPDSEQGNKKNAHEDVLYLGSDASNRQYRTILHFDVSSLPDDIFISKVLLLIKKKDVIGIDPFTVLPNALVDIHSEAFGSFGPFTIKGLQKSDFQAPASIEAVGVIENKLLREQYLAWLDSAAFPYIAQADSIQLRLRFNTGNNIPPLTGYLEFY
ncbi:MAG: right-handed parallel beta-helix repeat-containing protein, partial [Anaerolineales bacterium]